MVKDVSNIVRKRTPKKSNNRGQGNRAGRDGTNPSAPKQAPTKAALVVPAGAIKDPPTTGVGNDL
jgi:hypothetical protein